MPCVVSRGQLWRRQAPMRALARIVLVVLIGGAIGELITLVAERHGVDPALANLASMPFVFGLFVCVRNWHDGER